LREFRQDSPGDWGSVVATVHQALKTYLVRGHRGP
jgi:hypothetical protein